ncbi:unnamed protein product [Larinioides sclopetarius]|uniref:Uncharacterized protein n=1 Tax=Larinioides sclopetarius TaxID=280406 RepID=A0AAV2AB32_9ARAC
MLYCLKAIPQMSNVVAQMLVFSYKSQRYTHYPQLISKSTDYGAVYMCLSLLWISACGIFTCRPCLLEVY